MFLPQWDKDFLKISMVNGLLTASVFGCFKWRMRTGVYPAFHFVLR
jgi:hypothetical protein